MRSGIQTQETNKDNTNSNPYIMKINRQYGEKYRHYENKWTIMTEIQVLWTNSDDTNRNTDIMNKADDSKRNKCIMNKTDDTNRNTDIVNQNRQYE